ncbi:MAG: TraM recognition domain-containing protein [Patescibacteria group bacterium]
MEVFNIPVGEKLRTPEEEIAFLREQIAQKERELAGKDVEAAREQTTREVLKTYSETPREKVIDPSYEVSKEHSESITLELSPEAHDETMAELIGILQSKGFKAALDSVRGMNDPHIADDFERLLIQYLKAGFPAEGVKENSEMGRALHMTLFEITLPEKGEEEQKKTLKEMLISMEQFYSGMLSVKDDNSANTNYFTVELAVSNHSSEFVFYVAVHDSKKGLFEKQVLSIFHDAKVVEKKDDYNIFSEGGATVASYAAHSKNSVWPLTTYEAFEYDPLNILLNSFSKIDHDGEGASIQIVFSPCGDRYVKKYSEMLDKVLKGEETKEVVNAPEGVAKFLDGMFKFIDKSIETKADKEKREKKEKEEREKVGGKHVDQLSADLIKGRISTPIVETNIRIVASAQNQASAEEILSHIEASFNQFENTQGNALKWKRVSKGALQNFLEQFSFRLFDKDSVVPLSLRELTSIMHLPASVMKGSAQLKTAKAGTAPAPLDLPQQGVLIGVNRNRGIEQKVFMLPEDRLRHFYTIGQTGTGKTTLLKNMIIQDIQNGEGVCMIDPHGSDIQDILASIPRERINDVIYFDPSHTARPMGLNMLEYDVRYPEQKTFVVNEMLSIFNKLFDMKTAGGPMFEQYFRNSVLLVMEDPESGNTLLDVSRVLANKPFREMKIAKCKNPIVIQFWKEVAEKAGGEASLANIVPYITSKFDVFLSNDIMRPIIAQEKSAFNFRDVMDNKKILLVNLSKGRLGDINANLIGLILVGKILMAALSRVDSLGKDFPPFYLYIDEFQNITTDSIATILSEARKYRLSLNIAHQFIAQLEDDIKDAVFGNVGSIAAFRVGSEDAEFLEKQFEPVFTAKDIMNIDNRNAYIKMLVQGRPVKPFNIETMAPPKGNKDAVDKLKEISYLKYGGDRETIDAEILAKYRK